MDAEQIRDGVKNMQQGDKAYVYTIASSFANTDN